MQVEYKDRYPHQPPALPEYDVSPELKKLTLIMIGAMMLNFLIAGSLAIGMRILQSDVSLLKFDWIPQNVLWYALLTAHGQVMFFGVVSINTMWFGYYATSKWGRKPLLGMAWAKASFWIMEAAVVLILLAAISGFGAGWYNLMPLSFLPGRPMLSWGTMASTTFLIGDVLVGIGLTIFCIIVIATLLKGKIPTGSQKFGARHTDQQNAYDKSKEGSLSKEEEKEKKEGEMEDLEHTHLENLPAGVRWVSLLGISAWFPKKWRELTPAVPIVLVGAFVTAIVQIIGNPGLFLQLANGFLSLSNPTAGSNWLLTKDAWWFFAHPIVYFPLLIFLSSWYYFGSRTGGEKVKYNKWNYRPWPFYAMFSVLVFSHHVFMDIPNPVWLQMVAQTASLGIIFPSGLTIFTFLMFMWRSKVVWNVTVRFFIAGILGWAFGGFNGAEFGLWGADIYQHNTMVLPSHIHLILLMGPLLLAFGVIYAIIPDLTKKHLSKTLGEIHYWLTIFGGFGFAILFNIIGAEGAIRREANMPAAFDWSMLILLFFALCVGIAQFIFVYNFVKTWRRKATREEIEEYEILHKNPQGGGNTPPGDPSILNQKQR
ncbi:MAG: cbb3-type cytochrome c oxidase subunit I [Candidatus Nitrosocosmicus sp.]